VDSVTHPLLRAGLTYWIIVQAADPAINGAWGLSPTPGTFAVRQESTGGVWTPFVHELPYFEVNATEVVPEPASWGLLLTGLSVVALRRLC
jgi:hypothetical protein